ncbi:MAG: TonB family protein [Dysgonamonadaceae bacterium]|jgi:protein TonB|nr:TonB family protein [Dysgonamonadaceae bacterium]
MEEKKTSGANLENERPVFLLMGFIVVLSLLFVTFEWRNEQEDYPDPAMLSGLFVEEPFEMEFELPKEEQSSGEIEEYIEEAPQNAEYDGFDVKEEPLIRKEITDEVPDSHKVEHEQEVEEKVVEHPEEEIVENIATAPDTLPEFPGGRGALIRYIYQNLKYPSVALKQRIQGKVTCSFIVNEDGTVSDLKLEKSVYIFLDEEALRVLSMMPEWNPGKKNGREIKVKCYVPVIFKL